MEGESVEISSWCLAYKIDWCGYHTAKKSDDMLAVLTQSTIVKNADGHGVAIACIASTDKTSETLLSYSPGGDTNTRTCITVNISSVKIRRHVLANVLQHICQHVASNWTDYFLTLWPVNSLPSEIAAVQPNLHSNWSFECYQLSEKETE